MDYKNGNAPVSVEKNTQLACYTILVCEQYGIKPNKIKHLIFQKNEKKACNYSGKVLQLMREDILSIIEKVKQAEKNPTAHLDSNCKDFFCPAREYHKLRRNND